MAGMEHFTEMNWPNEPGDVTRGDIYFSLYLSMSIAGKKAERATKPDELRVLYGFILECFRELESKLPESSNQAKDLESTQEQIRRTKTE